MRTFALSRRRCLRGAGLVGISLALPQLEAMLTSRGRFWSPANAQGVAPPKRFFLLHWPQGVPTGWNGSPGVFYPKEEGAAWTMTPCLKPLEPHRADINVVSGLTYSAIHQSSGSHGHAVAIFTGWKTGGPGTDRELSRGPSVQHVAARALSTGTRFSLVSAGLYNQGEGWWSWSATGVKDPLEVDPVALWSRLFTNVNVDPTVAMRLARARKSVLDYVRADAADLQKSLGTEDRGRIDTHLASLRELEKAVTTVGPAAGGGTCTQPAKPADGLGKRAAGGSASDGATAYTDEGLSAYARVMIQLLVMAHRCDLTRSTFVSLGGSQNYTVFRTLGVDCNYHAVCHGNATECGDGTGQTKTSFYTRIATYHMSEVAYALGLLKANDGLGSLLDQTAFVATSEFGDGGLHYDSYVPFIVAGKAGRTGAEAMKTGRHVSFPCSLGADWRNGSFCAKLPGTPNRCINDLWQSALVGLGALDPAQKFGDPALATKPLEGLWV